MTFVDGRLKSAAAAPPADGRPAPPHRQDRERQPPGGRRASSDCRRPRSPPSAIPSSPRSAARSAGSEDGAAHLDAGRAVGPPADPRALARPHPARHPLLPRPRHRRHHQRELRRRVDRPHHAALRLPAGARIDVARRQAGAAADAARHGRGTAGGVHGGRSARAGLPGAARRRLAGEGDRQSGRAVPHRVGAAAGRRGSWDRTAGAEAVEPGRDRDRRAARRAGRCRRVGDRSEPPRTGAPPAAAPGARAGDAEHEACGRRASGGARLR